MVGIASTTVLSWTVFSQASLCVRRVAAASTAFLVSISPCHYTMSRLAVPEVSSTVFLTAGLSLLLTGVAKMDGKLKESPLTKSSGTFSLYGGTVVLAMAAYTHSELVVYTSLLYLVFCASFQTNKTSSGVRSLLLFVVVLLPAMYQYVSSTDQRVNMSNSTSPGRGQLSNILSRFGFSQVSQGTSTSRFPELLSKSDNTWSECPSLCCAALLL